jgi:hypothetical protein
MGDRRKPVRRRLFKFYVAKPKVNLNVEKLAYGLLALKNVDEVYITDRIEDSGILVKAKFEEESDGMEDALSKHLGKGYGEVHAIAYKRTQ